MNKLSTRGERVVKDGQKSVYKGIEWPHAFKNSKSLGTALDNCDERNVEQIWTKKSSHLGKGSLLIW